MGMLSRSRTGGTNWVAVPSKVSIRSVICNWWSFMLPAKNTALRPLAQHKRLRWARRRCATTQASYSGGSRARLCRSRWYAQIAIFSEVAPWRCCPRSCFSRSPCCTHRHCRLFDPARRGAPPSSKQEALAANSQRHWRILTRRSALTEKRLRVNRRELIPSGWMTSHLTSRSRGATAERDRLGATTTLGAITMRACDARQR
jgi:hypothetical protein